MKKQSDLPQSPMGPPDEPVKAARQRPGPAGAVGAKRAAASPSAASASPIQSPRRKPAAKAQRGDSDTARNPTADAGGVPANSREDRIREAAYRIFESRRHDGGDETDDWLRAEAEVDALERKG